MKWLRPKAVAEKLGLSQTGFRLLQKRDGTFPKEVRISDRHVVFDEDDINRWMRAQMHIKSELLTDTQEVTNESNGTQG